MKTKIEYKQEEKSYLMQDTANQQAAEWTKVMAQVKVEPWTYIDFHETYNEI